MEQPHQPVEALGPEPGLGIEDRQQPVEGGVEPAAESQGVDGGENAGPPAGVEQSSMYSG